MKRKFFVVNIYKMVCVWVCVKGCQNFLHVSKRSFTIKEIQLARHKMVVQSSKIIYSFFPWSSIYSDIVDSVMKSYLKVIWNDILTILSYIREWVHKCLFNKTDIVFWIFYAKCERHSRSKLLNREKEHWLTRLTSLAYDVSKTQSPYKAMLWIQISMSFCSILKEKKYYFI